MSPIAGTNRRKNPTGTPQGDDVREDLIRIVLDGFLPMAVLSAVCMVGVLVVVGWYYQDAWIWHLAQVTLGIAIIRLGIVVGFQRASERG